VAKISSVLPLLSDLEDSQCEYTLLRNCLSLPKLNSVLQTCPPSYITSSISSFDSMILHTLAAQAGSHLPTWSSLKASMPVALGGLGL
jgi:ubiquitin carboxyl-terminal hydrolase 44/49